MRLSVARLYAIQENRRYCNKSGYNSCQKIEYAYNVKEVASMRDSFNHHESPEEMVARIMYAICVAILFLLLFMSTYNYIIK